MRRGLAAAGAALVLSGCSTTTALDRAPVQERIAADVASFNEAYAEAANNLILWNVLRARDRLPRTYVAIKEITTSQGRSVERSWGLDGLNLGGDFGADPWGVASLGGSVSSSSEPSYGISPLVADDIGRAVLSPTPPRIFSIYWDSWGTHDVLLSVLVNRAVRLAPDAARRASECLSGPRDINGDTPLQQFVPPAEGEANVLRNQIDEPGDEPHGREFNEFARWAKEHSDQTRLHFIETYRCDEVIRVPFGGRGQRDASEARAFAQALAGDGRRLAQGEGNVIEVRPRPSIVTVLLEVTSGPFAGVWELELRSLDQAIFYLGESVRQPADDEAYHLWEDSRSHEHVEPLPPQPATPSGFGRIHMVAADCSNERVNAPLFRVWRTEPRRLRNPLFGDSAAPRGEGWQFDRMQPAARVMYRGALYEAGQPSPINSSCSAPADFSGSVLTLLAQLLAANQSPDSIRLPARFSD